ncbi:hypothetical protein CL628_04520 [bacterium]|nr:hypothetical protein [bacterium]|tara:strand:+ start:512 stop:907 length:396 start_codon:yes stop_codon:yes gene_type:complete
MSLELKSFFFLWCAFMTLAILNLALFRFYIELLPLWGWLVVYVLVNAVDVHSTVVSATFFGSTDDEAAPLPRRFMRRFGMIKGLVVMKITFGTAVAIPLALVGSPLVCTACLILSFVAIHNYLSLTWYPEI